MSGTVTATNTTGSPFPGGLLRVFVLDGAALAGTPATGSLSVAAGGGPLQAAITTTQVGSMVYGGICNREGTGTLTASSGTTILDQFKDTTNSASYCDCETTSPTSSPGSVNVGSSAPADGGSVAVMEVLANGTISNDASAPAIATTVAAVVRPREPTAVVPEAAVAVAVGADADAVAGDVGAGDAVVAIRTEIRGAESVGTAHGERFTWIAARAQGDDHVAEGDRAACADVV